MAVSLFDEQTWLAEDMSKDGAEIEWGNIVIVFRSGTGCAPGDSEATFRRAKRVHQGDRFYIGQSRHGEYSRAELH